MIGITACLMTVMGLTACTSPAPSSSAANEPKAQQAAETAYDWEDIQQSGELIVTTINGPETYFEQGETPMGKAYAIASAFAGDNGLRLRVEVATDTAQAMQMVATGEADICAIALNNGQRTGGRLLAAGPRDSLQTAWGVRTGRLASPQYRRAADKAWRAMAANAVHGDGFIGFLQGTGKEPKDGQPVTYTSIPDFEDYGAGCFLLCAVEYYKMLVGAVPLSAE